MSCTDWTPPSPEPTMARLLCSRCPFETTSLTEYVAHIQPHFKHVTPSLPPVPPAPSPDTVPTWSPRDREIL